MRATLTSSKVDDIGNVTEDVVEIIADIEGIDPTELTPPLYSVIDPDALNSLFQSSASDDLSPSVCVSFQYCGYEVHIESDGELTILNK